MCLCVNFAVTVKWIKVFESTYTLKRVQPSPRPAPCSEQSQRQMKDSYRECRVQKVLRTFYVVYPFPIPLPFPPGLAPLAALINMRRPVARLQHILAVSAPDPGVRAQPSVATLSPGRFPTSPPPLFN